MNRNTLSRIPAEDPNKKKGRHTPGRQAGIHELERKNEPATAHSGDESSRYPSGEWTHPITNHDEQRKATNAGDNNAMGEQETEGI